MLPFKYKCKEQLKNYCDVCLMAFYQYVMSKLKNPGKTSSECGVIPSVVLLECDIFRKTPILQI